MCVVFSLAACGKTESTSNSEVPVNQVYGRRESTPEERDEAIKKLKERMKEVEAKKQGGGQSSSESENTAN